MKKILPILTILISASTFAQQTVVPFKEGKKWGVITTDGTVTIEPSYKDIKPFCEEGIALAFDFKSKRWLFINADNGEVSMPYKTWEPKKYFGFGQKGFINGRTQLLVRDKLALVNTKGEEIYPPNFIKMSQFHRDVAIGKLGTIWYLLHKDGTKTKIETKAEAVDHLKNGYAPFKTTSKKWGFVDASGAVVIKAQFHSVGYFHNGLAWARTMDKKVGYINPKGEWVIEAKYDKASNFDNDSKIARVRKGDNWMYIRPDGSTFEVADAVKVGEFSHDRAWVRVGDLTGYVDMKGDWVVEPAFEKANNFTDEGFAFVKQGDNWGIVNDKGEFVLEAKYSKIADLRQGMVFIREGDHVGIAKYSGEIIVEPTFQAVKDYYDGYAMAKSGNKWGLIDLQGEWVLQPVYTDLRRATTIK